MRQRVKAAVDEAKEILGEAEPAIKRVTDVADRVASRFGIAQATAKKYLRLGCDEGELVELEPDSRFYVRLPEAAEAGIRDLRIVQRYEYKDGRFRKPILILSTDEKLEPPSRYGPGGTTYLVTTDYVTRLVAQIVEERKAKAKKDEEEREEQRRRERAEIRRRHPGLLNLSRRLSLILGFSDGYYGRAEARLHEPWESRKEEKQSIQEWELHFDVSSHGEMVPVLMEIMTVGLEAHLAKQPVVECAHCGERILYFERQGGWWWHLKSTRAKCKDAETMAAPQENGKEMET
jgi:DNA-directed RNA polymerase subunit RPC12/RpoP